MMTPPARNSAIPFAVTTLIALLIYSMTLAPQVTFGYSGIFAAAAMHPGPSTPSGHPIWAIIGWCWINLFQFGNIAWRLSVGSALAAAIACGIVAQIVARVGALISHDHKRWPSAVAGIVAGLGLAFEQGFWSKAVVVDSWSLTALIFTAVLYSASRWFFEPTQRRWLYAAAFLSGAGLCESQALAPPIYVFPLLVALADLKTGRNLFLAEALLLCAWLAAQNQLADVGWQVTAMWRFIEALATASTIAWLFCWWRTGRPFGDFRCSAKCVALFTTGLLLCFLNPVLSLTNPPVNWGYPRTDEGFFHVLSRGQFDSFAPPPQHLPIHRATIRLRTRFSIQHRPHVSNSRGAHTPAVSPRRFHRPQMDRRPVGNVDHRHPPHRLRIKPRTARPLKRPAAFHPSNRAPDAPGRMRNNPGLPNTKAQQFTDKHPAYGRPE